MQNRTDVPGTNEFPDSYPHLQSVAGLTFQKLLPPGHVSGLTSRPVTLVCFYGEASWKE